MSALHVRLALAVALLFSLAGAASFLIFLRASEAYADELRQRRDAGVAMYVVEEMSLLAGDRPDMAAFDELAQRAMILNPSAEVYLLDPDGRVLAPLDGLARSSVRLAPIHRFLGDAAARPLYGDDPAAADRLRIFSAAPIGSDGRVLAYLYVTLGGGSEPSLLSSRSASYALRAGAGALGVVIIATIACAAGLFFFLTRPLRKLERTIAEAAPTSEPRLSEGGEIARISRRFDLMSATIERQMSALKQADQSRRELFASVSHDLRTPLASLRGYVETALLRAPHADRGEIVRHLAVALRQADQLGALIDSAFELARLEAPGAEARLEPIAVADLIQDIAMRFKLMAQTADVRLITELDTSGVEVLADIGLIERALSNLIENALRHTPAGGEIRLSMRVGERGVTVAVADNGSGFDQLAIRPQRPNDISAAQTRTGRRGFGLPIVRLIVGLHGQDLRIASRPGEGAVIEFTLEKLNAGRLSASPAETTVRRS